MLLRCSTLLLLSMLQLVVLSGIVAAYIYSHSSPQPPPPQTAAQLMTASRDRFPGHERTMSLDPKTGVMLKPISLSYLRDSLQKVSSLVDFIRLFTISEAEDRHINHLISRTIRSASHPKSHQFHLNPNSKNHPFHINQPQYNDHDNADFSGVGENNDGNDLINDGFMSLDTPSTVGGGVRDRASSTSDLTDHGYGYDYPHDEPSSDDFEAFEAALHHIEEMKTCSTSKCQRPTPYVLNVRDDHDWSRVFFPECVILHRCMNYSGCCGDGDHECAPKSMNIVVKSFMVVNRLSPHGDDVMFDANMATTLSFLNHTECECREKPKLPKCTKECPKHFRLTQEGADCLCDCFPSAGAQPWDCESLKYGVTPLSVDDLACIHGSKCYTPRCAEGEFDVATGYCSLSTEYALPAFLFEKPADRHHYRKHLRHLDFTSLRGTGASAVDSSFISPTPASRSGVLLPNNIDKLKDIEDLLSRKSHGILATYSESGLIQDSSSIQSASLFPTLNGSANYGISNVSFIGNSSFSVDTNEHSSNNETNVPALKSTNELQSSVYPSYDDEHADNNDDEDDDDVDYNDFYSEFSSSEGQGLIDSTSHVKVQETANQFSVASTALPGDVQTEVTNNQKLSSKNAPHDLNLKSSAMEDGQGVTSYYYNDDDKDNDDDVENISEDESSKNDNKDSSYTDYYTDSASTDYYKDSEDLLNNNLKDSLNTDYYSDSSFEYYQKDPLVEGHQKDSSDKYHQKDSSNNHHKASSRKDRLRVERHTPLKNNLRHQFKSDSQFHETVGSDRVSEGEHTEGRNINSEYRVFNPLSAVPSIVPSYYSTPTTKLPKKSFSSQTSSSSPKLSSLSPQPSSPLSKLSLMFSLTKSPGAQEIETSTKTLPTNKQDLKTSTETSFLRRLYQHFDTQSEGSGEDGG